ncbi:MAG: ASCH domain-containing protein, partial [Candidatus Bathyarchaeia archaeon]
YATPQPRKYHPGSIQSIQTSWFSKPIGYIKIISVQTERLGDITEEDAKAEGFENLAEFQKTWKQIYGEWNPNALVTVYTFTLFSANFIS